MSRRSGTLTAAALAIGCVAWLASADPLRAAPDGPGALPATVSLDTVLELLETRSPATLAELATVDVAAAERITAGTLPNPVLDYSGVKLVEGSSTGAELEQQFVLNQPLLLFGQRGARREAADRGVDAEQARAVAAIAERRLQARQAFVSLLARQEEAHLLERSLSELLEIERIVRGRAAAGDRSQYDVLRVETERLSLRVDALNAATEVGDASGRLAALLGFPGWRPQADGSLERSDVPADGNALWESARSKLPALAAAMRRQSAAAAALASAERDGLPVPTLNGGAQLTQDVRGTSAVFGLTLPLPLFDRNQGAVARARAQLDVETRHVQAETARARADLERAAETLAGRRRALGVIETEIEQRAPTLRRMAEDAYREGQAGILELLDATRSLKEIQILRIHQLESTKLAEQDVIAAAGLDAR
ncbi:MAG TPA: TolC family protein [Thermoanaerobaculia bacterium]|nr:TolC family protein [Thermoanaerobaculia bacterium]